MNDKDLIDMLADVVFEIAGRPPVYESKEECSARLWVARKKVSQAIIRLVKFDQNPESVS